MDYNSMIKEIDALCEGNDFLAVNYIGESIMCRGIPMIVLGYGKKQTVYVGAQSGRDSIISAVLLRFVKEYISSYKSKAKLYGLPIEYLASKVSIAVLPMLNPDGVEYCLNGISGENPIKERILKANNGSGECGVQHLNIAALMLLPCSHVLFSLCLDTQSCLTLCSPMNCIPPASLSMGFSQARIL